MKKNITLAFLTFTAMVSFGEIRLPALVSNNMVLQQQSKINIWGWASPAERIRITTSWNNITDSVVTTRDANWQMTIQTPVAGGPYTITLQGNNKIVLENVLIGEVWVCSGQSNMEFGYYNRLKDVKDELPVSYNTNIRFFHIPKTTALYPQEDCKASWVICDSNSLKTFSAVGYFFGKRLNRELNTPIGLINSSWGGTPAETWTPEEIIKSDPILKNAAEKLTPATGWPHKPGYTFNAMIAPLANYAIAGAIWYQGESNTGTANTYKKLFTLMIDSWRKQWNKDFPFYYVQIAPYKYGNKDIGALLQEAQTQSMSHKNVGMVVITDLVDDTNDIHPANKHDVGYRLANWALAETYSKKEIAHKSPVYKTMNVEKGKAVISFDFLISGLISKDKIIRELYIAGNDKIFYPAQAKILNDKLIVWSKMVAEPIAVRFAFGNTAIGNLFSKEGLPVTPFRTDNWETYIQGAAVVKPAATSFTYKSKHR